MTKDEIFDYNKRKFIAQLHIVLDDLEGTSDDQEMLVILDYMKDLIGYKLTTYRRNSEW